MHLFLFGNFLDLDTFFILGIFYVDTFLLCTFYLGIFFIIALFIWEFFILGIFLFLNKKNPKIKKAHFELGTLGTIGTV